jgi:hypothetical protein
MKSTRYEDGRMMILKIDGERKKNRIVQKVMTSSP